MTFEEIGAPGHLSEINTIKCDYSKREITMNRERMSAPGHLSEIDAQHFVHHAGSWQTFRYKHRVSWRGFDFKLKFKVHQALFDCRVDLQCQLCTRARKTYYNTSTSNSQRETTKWIEP